WLFGEPIERIEPGETGRSLLVGQVVEDGEDSGSVEFTLMLVEAYWEGLLHHEPACDHDLDLDLDLALGSAGARRHAGPRRRHRDQLAARRALGQGRP